MSTNRGFATRTATSGASSAQSPLDHQAYKLDVPPTLPPVDFVLSKHRARAIERRRHWARITQRAEAAVRGHRLHRAHAIRPSESRRPGVASAQVRPDPIPRQAWTMKSEALPAEGKDDAPRPVCP